MLIYKFDHFPKLLKNAEIHFRLQSKFHQLSLYFVKLLGSKNFPSEFLIFIIDTDLF